MKCQFPACDAKGAQPQADTLHSPPALCFAHWAQLTYEQRAFILYGSYGDTAYSESDRIAMIVEDLQDQIPW